MASRTVSRLAAGVRAAAVLAVLAGALGAPRVWSESKMDQEIQDQKSQLEQLRRQAEAKRKEARAYAAKEKGVLSGLNEVEEALAATRKYIRRLEAESGRVQAEIRKTVVDLSYAQDELTSRRTELSRRLRYSYMYSKARALEVVFSADSFPNLLQRTAFLNRVLQQDQKLVDTVAEREAAVKEKLSRLEQQRDELRVLEEQKASEEREFESLRTQRMRDLNAIRNQKDAQLSAAKELEAAAAEMENLLADLERRRQEALRRNNPQLTELDEKDFYRNKGRLPWPVTGDVITGFGRQEHPKYKTVTLSNGVDIAAPIGTAVQAVGNGLVDLVRWLPGYGETVILNHGRGYYSIYGHLSSVTVRQGDLLKPGDVLGTVGDTGSLKGACLHFELRQGGAAQNPEDWLR